MCVNNKSKVHINDGPGTENFDIFVHHVLGWIGNCIDPSDASCQDQQRTFWLLMHHTGTFVSQESVRLVKTNPHSDTAKREICLSNWTISLLPCTVQATHLAIAEDSVLEFGISTTIIVDSGD